MNKQVENKKHKLIKKLLNCDLNYQETKQCKGEIRFIDSIVQLFPDLKIYKDRWEVERYYSAIANPIVNNFLMLHSCGCCTDSPLFVYPHFTYNGFKVFSNPIRFRIGEASECVAGGELYDKNCIKEMKNNNISEKVIQDIKVIVSKEPEYLDDDDDEY